MSKNAYEYLMDYADDEKCNPWISKVIKTFLDEKGKLSEESQKKLIADLLEEEEFVIDCTEIVNVLARENTIRISKLEHISGVNALASNQLMKFCPDVNIVYGLNGTGKSSYFRILNEVVGGSKHKKIIGNIYSEENEDVLAKIEYTVNNTKKVIQWDNTSRGIEDFATVRVFDSAYTEGLLKKRDSDNLLLKPYGLNVFAELISKIDDLLNNARVELAKREIPEVDKSELSDETKALFDKKKFEQEDVEQFKMLSSFLPKEEERLESIVEELNALSQVNISDKIQIEKEHKYKVEKLKEKLNKICDEFQVLYKEVCQLIVCYNEKKSAAEKSQKQYELLLGLPGIKTESWKNFIDSGRKYIDENGISENECPYCHRVYDENALKIVSEYANFLSDENEIKLQKCINDLNKKKIDIQNLELINDEDYDVEYISDSLKKQIFEINNALRSNREMLISSIKSKKEVQIKNDINKIDCELSKIISEYEIRITKYSADDSEKRKTMDALIKEKLTLSEKKSINNQYAIIEKYIEIKNNLFRLNSVIDSISTTKISSLSKKAHNELLTVKLQEKFKELLHALNVNNISIELKGQNNKGIQQTELIINSHKNVDNILSEGEQKATALALFLSEIVLSENESTLIFDDPVNSMDHRMMGAFADQLLKLNNQIIVFTHNKMFLDSFAVSEFGHFCKTYNSACNKVKGKHILVYETQSEGKNRKGVIVEKTIENAEYYLKEIGHLLEETPFVKKEETCMKLRKAVELLIDERVFNKQVPTKYSTKSSRIAWEELKKLCNDPSVVDKLKSVHNRASGGELHNGMEREENPIDKDEIQEMYDMLKSI
ncbi:MAG: AAA family ATPase [Erysipelotrichaceae bacterium]|nr:AAA family ATPase [Erysipelotrichaceae bacterium]